MRHFQDLEFHFISQKPVLLCDRLSYEKPKSQGEALEDETPREERSQDLGVKKHLAGTSLAQLLQNPTQLKQDCQCKRDTKQEPPAEPSTPLKL